MYLFYVCMCVNVDRQLRYVRERCEREPDGEGVAALTSEERTRWANVRLLTFDYGIKKPNMDL